MNVTVNLLKYLCIGIIILLSCKPDPKYPGSNLRVAQVKQMMAENSNLVILDVRTPEETALGKIEGAMEINFKRKDFMKEIQNLDPEKEYVIYCASGRRSKKTWNRMQAVGIYKVYNMLGGYEAWENDK